MASEKKKKLKSLQRYSDVDGGYNSVDEAGYMTPVFRDELMIHQTSSPIDYYADYVLSDEELAEIIDDDDEEDEEEDGIEIVNVEGSKPIQLVGGSNQLPSALSKHLDDKEEGDADDEGDVTPRPRAKSVDFLVTPRSGNRKQTGQMDAIMVDDKPWRRSSSRKRQHRAQHHKSVSAVPPSVVPNRTILRFVRSWGSRDRGSQEFPDDDLPGTPSADRVEPQDAFVAPDNESSASSSSGENSFVDDESSDSYSMDEGDLLNREEDVDWSTLPPLPNGFAGATSGNPNYLDSTLIQAPLQSLDANKFVWEHGILLQAVLQLLAERDQVGIEGSVDSPENVWKKGPLKKLSLTVRRPPTGTWKVKYVELRQGNLCYYEDSGPSSGRKMIHLRQADTVVQESKSFRGPGFVFELSVKGSPTRFWMATSEEERHAWMKAIQVAAIGNDGVVARELDLAPHREAISIYNALRSLLKKADTLELYLDAIHSIMSEVASIQVPVQWVREQVKQLTPSPANEVEKSASQLYSSHKRLKSSVADFWKKVGQTTFSLNGSKIPRFSHLAGERVVGGLTRAILDFDKAFRSNQDLDRFATISELQSIFYARTILNAGLRNKQSNDTDLVANHLLLSKNLVEIVSSPPEIDLDEAIQLDVSFAGEDLPDDFYPSSDEKTCWIWTSQRRMNSTSSLNSIRWRRRYAVLSGAVLSYYEADSPRPHGLRGQTVLDPDSRVYKIEDQLSNDMAVIDEEGEAKMTVVSIISSRGQERLLSFENESDADAWLSAIQAAIDSCPQVDSPTTAMLRNKAGISLVKGAERVIRGAADGSIRSSIRVIRSAKDGGIKAIRSATDGGMKALRGAVGRFRPGGNNSAKDEEKIDNVDPQAVPDFEVRRSPSMLKLLSNTTVPGKKEPTVQCLVHTSQTYSVRVAGDDSMARLLTVRCKVYQAFVMSGGSQGRIAGGDALVAVHFLENTVAEDDFGEGIVDIDDEI